MATVVGRGGPCLAVEPSAATSGLIGKLLHVAQEATGMDVAWVSSFRDGAQVFEVLSGDVARFGLVPGAASPLKGSYCVRVLDGRMPNVVNDGGADPETRDLPVTGDLGIGSYVGVPIPGPGSEPVGMLCCISKAANERLGDADVRFMELLAGAVSALLRDDRVESDRQRRVRDRVGRVIRQGRLQAYLQPIMSLRTGDVIGAEALARFPAEPTRPDRWFADAASVGLGTALELAAIRVALAHLPALGPSTYLSVNASPRLLCSGELHRLLADVPTGRMVVEVTEHEPVNDYDELLDAVTALRRAGARLAIDDVGAGFASFAHVLRLQPDIMKMDITITRGIDRDPARRGLARGIVSVARDTGATVVAEGVETQAELDTLLHIGVDAAQGYFVAKPAITLPRTRLPRPTAVLTDAPAAAPSIGAPGLTAAATNLHEDDEGLARRLLEAVLDRTGMETSYLTVLDAATGGLEHRYVRNTSDLVIPEGTVVPWEQTLCKRCRDARIRWTADVPAELPGGHAAEALGVTTFLSIPVRQPDGAVIGTLCAASRERRYIAASTLDDLEELARQLGRRIAAPVTSSALHGGPGIDRGATAPR